MLTLAAIFASAAVAAAPPSPQPGKAVGACAWGKIAAADRARVLSAYHEDRTMGLQALLGLGDQVAVALEACAPKSRIPDIFLHRALWAEMTQAGAAQELSTSGVTRAALEASWKSAPATARACLHNRLGPNFGLSTPDCKQPVEAELAQGLKLESAGAQLQASIFYLAKAEGEWAESMIAHSPFR